MPATAAEACLQPVPEIVMLNPELIEQASPTIRLAPPLAEQAVEPGEVYDVAALAPEPEDPRDKAISKFRQLFRERQLEESRGPQKDQTRLTELEGKRDECEQDLMMMLPKQYPDIIMNAYGFREEERQANTTGQENPYVKNDRLLRGDMTPDERVRANDILKARQAITAALV